MKNKKLFVGAQAPVGQAVSAAKYVPAVAGTAVSASPYHHRTVVAVAAARPVQQAVTQAPPVQSSWRGSPFVYPSDSQSSPLRFPSGGGSSTAAPAPQRSAAVAVSQYRGRPISGSSNTGGRGRVTTASPLSNDDGYYSVRPVDVNSIAATANGDDHDDAYHRRSSGPVVQAPESSSTAPPPLYEQPLRPHTFRPAYRKVVDMSGPDAAATEAQYDGVSFVRNGFKYYLPRHYHEEQSSDGTGDTRAGSYGYVDPFGIRRVVYYNTAPGTGFVHRKNNRYVGLDAEPYDPRPQ